MLGFIFGFIVGAVVAGGALIVFGKNNKRKIEAARNALIELYNKLDGDNKKMAEDGLNKSK